MESNNQNADLHEFFKQLLTVEIMLEKASWYNQSLTFQIDKLKKIVNCNQNIFGKHEDSDHNIKSHGDTLDELMNTSLTSHATNIQEKVKSLKNNTIYLMHFNNIASSFSSQQLCSRILRASVAKKELRILSCANN